MPPVAPALTAMAAAASVASSVVNMTKDTPSMPTPTTPQTPSSWNITGSSSTGGGGGGVDTEAGMGGEAVPSGYSSGTGIGAGLPASRQAEAVSSSSVPNTFSSSMAVPSNYQRQKLT